MPIFSIIEGFESLTAVMFHPFGGKINKQLLPEEAYLGLIDLLNIDVVSLIKSSSNLPKVIRIAFQPIIGNPLRLAIHQRIIFSISWGSSPSSPVREVLTRCQTLRNGVR
jgi:hypothetical protein